MISITETLSQELGQKQEYVENVVALLDEGNTIPFIARYRKEMHGAMDDTVLRTLETRLNYLRNLQERKQEICNAIASQGKLTEELHAAIEAAATLAEAEDLYRPYKQKRRTRATVAKEKGLEPLALALYAQNGEDPATLAADYSTSIDSFVTENITKFIIGQRSMSEWDTFKAELLELPIDELLAVYEDAYNRVK